ncbi:MAG: hypothetical protein KBA28_11060 [Syntrophaceae bacterium]|nr:hypothetical protein [Syntrophaceae bacterium]
MENAFVKGKNAKRSIFSEFIEDYEIINQYDRENVQLHHSRNQGKISPSKPERKKRARKLRKTLRMFYE